MHVAGSHPTRQAVTQPVMLGSDAESHSDGATEARGDLGRSAQTTLVSETRGPVGSVVERVTRNCSQFMTRSVVQVGYGA